MLSQADLERALALALGEFGPAWNIIGDCAPVDPSDPSHWDSGSQSIQVTIRHRVTGHLKVLGRRVSYEPGASLHRAVALSLIEAYRHGNGEPIRQYLEEIGVAATAGGDAANFFRRPALVTSPRVSNGVAAEVVVVAAPAPDVSTAVSEDTDIPRHPPRSGASTSWRSIAARPRWPSLSTVRSRWRRAPPRPALSDAAGDSGGPVATVESRRRMLKRLKRELAIWQWRRAASSESARGTRIPRD